MIRIFWDFLSGICSRSFVGIFLGVFKICSGSIGIYFCIQNMIRIFAKDVNHSFLWPGSRPHKEISERSIHFFWSYHKHKQTDGQMNPKTLSPAGGIRKNPYLVWVTSGAARIRLVAIFSNGGDEVADRDAVVAGCKSHSEVYVQKVSINRMSLNWHPNSAGEQAICKVQHSLFLHGQTWLAITFEIFFFFASILSVANLCHLPNYGTRAVQKKVWYKVYYKNFFLLASVFHDANLCHLPNYDSWAIQKKKVWYKLCYKRFFCFRFVCCQFMALVKLWHL